MKLIFQIKKYKFLDYYLVLVGTVVVLFWGNFIVTNEEFTTEIRFHIFSELLMAAFCIMAGFRVISGKRLFFKIAALAMLIYSTLNAAGFYAEQNNLAMLFLFVTLFVVSFFMLTYLFFNKTP